MLFQRLVGRKADKQALKAIGHQRSHKMGFHIVASTFAIDFAIDKVLDCQQGASDRTIFDHTNRRNGIAPQIASSQWPWTALEARNKITSKAMLICAHSWAIVGLAIKRRKKHFHGLPLNLAFAGNLIKLFLLNYFVCKVTARQFIASRRLRKSRHGGLKSDANYHLGYLFARFVDKWRLVGKKTNRRMDMLPDR